MQVFIVCLLYCGLLQERNVSDLTCKEWLFVVVSAVGILAATGLTVDRIVEEGKDTPVITVEFVLLVTIGKRNVDRLV